MSIRDAGAWVAPQADPPWKNFARWGHPECGDKWAGWTTKQIPVLAADGGVLLRMNLLEGQRKWTLGEHADGKLLMDCLQFNATGLYTPLPRLNEVKDMLLDWRDDGNLKHPYLLARARDIEMRRPLAPAAYDDGHDPAKLRQMLDRLGTLDYMRHVMDVAVRYDLVIDSGQLSPADRKLVKAQTALLAYLVADPFHWSFERGFCSGNPNMTVSRLEAQAMLGLALRDHPLSKTWSRPMLDWSRTWLREVVDASGSWPESAHYGRVSWADFVWFAIAARQAKLEDFFVDANFQRMALFYEKTLMPPHPLRRASDGLNGPGLAARVDSSYGRGIRNDAWGLSGLLAAATAGSDPEFSRVMQWSWRESGFSSMCSHAAGGMNLLLCNPRLPSQRPDWRSEYYPNLGALLRSAVGDPLENYLLLVTQHARQPDGEIWPPDVGAIANWYAYGCPLGGSFPRAPETTHPLTACRVALATNWDPATGVQPGGVAYSTETRDGSFVVLPQVEYVEAQFQVPSATEFLVKLPLDVPAFPRREAAGKTPFAWRRQLLQVTDPQPQGTQYLVLRDTVSGSQPTQWQFWTLSEKIGMPSETADRATFLQDRPGYATAPLRELKGDRFTALGQFGVDVEYYVASPADTARYTLRYGVQSGAYGVVGKCPHYQDLLYLQLPGDGSYYVALVPRRPPDASPEFATLGDGRILKIAGPQGTDYCFLSEKPAQAATSGLAISGTAACVRDRIDGLHLCLLAAGTLQYRDYALCAPAAASLQVSPYTLALTLSERFTGGTLTITAPGTWTIASPLSEVALRQTAAGWELTLPPGGRNVQLRRAGLR